MWDKCFPQQEIHGVNEIHFHSSILFCNTYILLKYICMWLVTLLVSFHGVYYTT